MSAAAVAVLTYFVTSCSAEDRLKVVTDQYETRLAAMSAEALSLLSSQSVLNSRVLKLEDSRRDMQRKLSQEVKDEVAKVWLNNPVPESIRVFMFLALRDAGYRVRLEPPCPGGYTAGTDGFCELN